MNNKEITDHSLHLLMDNQLDPASEKKLRKEIQASPELQQKLKNICEIKELVALAYIQEQPKVSSGMDKAGRLDGPFFVALAASLIMTVGLTLGWFAHQQYKTEVYVVANTDSRVELSRPEVPLQINLQHARKYMMHFDSMNESKFNSALIETTSILNSYAKSGLPVQLDLLFDQQSVHMFKPQHAAQIQQLKGLINKHENIQFYACSESLRMFLGNIEMPEEIKLFHSDEVVREMIPERIEQGWVYIKA